MRFVRACRALGRGPGVILEVLEVRQLLATSVLTWHNNLSRTGLNDTETVLTPGNVNSGSFGKLGEFSVDGQVYAQPLYVPGLSIPGVGTRSVVFVATEHDSVYAFDVAAVGKTQTPLWKASFIDPSAGLTTVSTNDVGTGDISPEIGITGTPVIDSTTGTLYVLSKAKRTVGNTQSFVQQLHALDVATGQEKFGGPVTISASVPGTGEGSVNGRIAFDARTANQRSGLVLLNGVVYIAWASHGDMRPYQGWVMGYDAATLQQKAALNLAPGGWGAGVWMARAAPAVDAAGDMYLTTGNGLFNAHAAGNSYGDSLLRISTANGGLQVVDYFSPFNQESLSNSDLDFGSSGVMLAPDQPGAYPHQVIDGGKGGKLYVQNRHALGGYDGNSDHVLQSIDMNSGMFGTPAYFNGSIYVNTVFSPLEQYAYQNGQLRSTPSSFSTLGAPFPGATPSVSSNGTSNGIVWTIYPGTNAQLFAHDATNVRTTLYDNTTAGSRDALPGGIKFSVPTVADGHVLVGTASSLAIFGLLGPVIGVPPIMPQGLTATSLSPGSAKLAWILGTDATGGYRIERAVGNGAFVQVDTVPPSTSTYTDVSLLASTLYVYRIRAANASGVSFYSATASVTTPPASSLVGYWPMDEGAGVATVDASGYGNSGQLSGESTWIDGRAGNAALNFHGAGVANAHVGVPDESVLRFGVTDSFSIGAWVSPNTLPGKWAGIVTKSPDSGAGYGLYLDPDNHWVFATGVDTNVLVGNLATTGWHYVLALQDGVAGTRRLYVDGVQVAEGLAATASGLGSLWIGGAENQPTEYFNGAIDEVRIDLHIPGDNQIQRLAQSYKPAAATDLAATPNASNSIHLEWTDHADNETGYIVERSLDGVNFALVALLDQPGTASYDDRGLSFSTSYTYRVMAYNDFGQSLYTNPAIVTSSPAPAKNLALAAPTFASSQENGSYAGTMATDGKSASRWSSGFSDPQWIYVDLGDTYDVSKVVLKWEAAYARSYDIQVAKATIIQGEATPGNWVSIYSTTNGQGGLETITNLSGAGRYVRMRGTQRKTIFGYSLFEFEVYGTPTNPVPRPPDAPASLSAVAGPGRVTLTWPAVANATSYNVFRGTTPGGEDFVPIVVGLPASQISDPIIDDSVSNGTTYYYYVIAVNGVGASLPSPEAGATPQSLAGSIDRARNRVVTASSIENGAYAASNAVDGDAGTRWSSAFSDPQWIAVDLGSVFTVNRVVLSWETASARSFRIETSLDQVSWTTIYSTTGGTPNLTGFSSSGRYVRIYCTQRNTQYGYSLYDFKVFGDPGSSPRPIAPGIPDALTATSTTSGISLNWSTVSDAASYSIYRGLSAGGEGAVAYQTGVTGTSFIDSGVLPGTTYYYIVRAVNSAGEGSASSEISARQVVILPVQPSGGNLALNRPVFTSSQEDGSYSGAQAVDGLPGTRWSSAFSDPQWITVDLGAVSTITRVTLNWEAASARAYQIQVSDDNQNWTVVYSTTAGAGGVATCDVATSGRYVRVYGTTRNTAYGYSLYELQVFGTGTTSTPTQPTNVALGSVATASSIENGNYSAGKAVDGAAGTRWASLFSDPQWLQLDLGASYDISKIVLNWEAASARAYQIQVSSDGQSWITLYATTTGTGGLQTLSGLTGSGRYVRIDCTQRNTQWGYSLHEVEVWGLPSA